MEKDAFNSVVSWCDVKPRKPGILSGMKFSVKDNIAVKGVRMTCGSRFLEGYTAPYDATVVERLLDAGAEITCKANLDEFACGGSGENSAFGATLNPVHEGKVPGGSSSGSGATVAGGLVDAGIGSDTGGSVRCPASFCGLVAFKPSYGVVSRFGLADMAMSLEGPAPIAKTVRDVAKVMQVIAGKDERDCTSIEMEEDFVSGLDSFSLKGKRVAVLDFEGVDVETKTGMARALALLESEGAVVEMIHLEALKYAVPAYYLIVYAEFSSAMQKFSGQLYGKGEGLYPENRKFLGDEVKRRILLGTLITMKEFEGKWYSKALAAREAIRKEFEVLFQKYDLLVSPTMPFTPYGLGEKANDPLQMYLADAFTVPANLAGLPAGVVPVKRGVGVQFIGRKFDDAKVLGFMQSFERARGELS